MALPWITTEPGRLPAGTVDRMRSTAAPVRVVVTNVPQSWSWMARDLRIRIAPFAAVCLAVEIIWRPSWMGFGAGRIGEQLAFGLITAPILFFASTWVQLRLARRRGAMSAPSGPADAWFQAGYYALNGPVEEALFRGLIQGGLGALLSPPIGFVVGTAAYVLYHRLGWSWPDTLATALLGVPVGLAFWLLPGPPSLLGVSIAHIGATCGFLGPGPYLLKKLNLL
jgi:membrane protease YdiL (CAAX protease family)